MINWTVWFNYIVRMSLMVGAMQNVVRDYLTPGFNGGYLIAAMFVLLYITNTEALEDYREREEFRKSALAEIDSIREDLKELDEERISLEKEDDV